MQQTLLLCSGGQDGMPTDLEAALALPLQSEVKSFLSILAGSRAAAISNMAVDHLLAHIGKQRNASPRIFLRCLPPSRRV